MVHLALWVASFLFLLFVAYVGVRLVVLAVSATGLPPFVARAVYWLVAAIFFTALAVFVR